MVVATAPAPQIVRPEDRKYKTVLVFGATGTGKSWFGASGESTFGGRTLVLMTEDASGLEGFDVDVVHVRSSADAWAVLRALKAGTPPYDRYKDGVLVWDSLTQMEAFLDAIDAEEEVKRGNAKTALLIGGDSYRRVQEDIRRMIWAGRSLPMHQVYICLDRAFTSKDDFITTVGPDLTPSLSNDVRSYCDVVGYMTADLLTVTEGGKPKVGPDGKPVKQLVRRLHLQRGDGFHARVRAGKGVTVPAHVTSPSLHKLLQILKGETK